MWLWAHISGRSTTMYWPCNSELNSNIHSHQEFIQEGVCHPECHAILDVNIWIFMLSVYACSPFSCTSFGMPLIVSKLDSGTSGASTFWAFSEYKHTNHEWYSFWFVSFHSGKKRTKAFWTVHFGSTALSKLEDFGFPTCGLSTVVQLDDKFYWQRLT